MKKTRDSDLRTRITVILQRSIVFPHRKQTHHATKQNGFFDPQNIREFLTGQPQIVLIRFMQMLRLFIIALWVAKVDARTWKDTLGREMEAEIVRADTSIVTLRKAGKEFKMALTKLSESDREYILEWIENDGDVDEPEAEKNDDDAKKTTRPDPPAKPAGGSLQFDGKELKTGGHINVYEYPYDELTLKKLKKTLKPEDTGYKIGIAVPDDFDPTKPQKVFIVCCAVNNDGQARSGNLGAMRSYVKACLAAGWVCLVYDSIIGRSNHDGDIYGCFATLNRVWPNVKTWQFATGGFSGGSKACYDPCAYLLKNEYPVLGVFMGGCNHDNSQSGRTRYKTSGSDYRNLRIYLSTGSKDNLVSAAQLASVISSLKANGMKTIRSEVFDGGHTLLQTHFEQSLQWIASTEK